MSASGPPRIPDWVRRVMARLMTPEESAEALAELDDLHTHWTASVGRGEADRRYRRELRRFPRRLAARWLRTLHAQEPTLLLAGVARNLRALARAPVLTGSIVSTVGVGIGGCTAIFAVADALFLRPLPYPEPERLAWIYTDAPPNQWPFSVVDYRALEEQQTSFAEISAYRSLTRTFVAGDVAELVRVWEVTTGFFELLGVAPAAGRTALPAEGVPDSPPTALVTAGFASTRLGAPSDQPAQALGASITLDGIPYEVIGVLPEGFGPLGAGTQVFATQQMRPATRKGPFFLRVFGRLEDGVDRDAAAAELRAINERIFPIWEASYQDRSTSWGVAPLEAHLNWDAGRLVVLLAGAVGLLLLLSTANAANLLLTRVRERRRELAVRVALGASRARVTGHLVAESALLAAGGVVAGAALARAALAALPTVAGAYIPRLAEVSLNGRALGFAALLAVGTGLFFGLVAGLQGSGRRPLDALRSGGRSATAGRRTQRSQRILVAAQVAVAVPLLAGAALLFSSLRNLNRSDPGFEAEGLLSMRVSISSARHPSLEDRQQLWRDAQARIGAIPGVVAVGLADSRPPVEADNYNNFDLEDHPTPPGANQPVTPWVAADADYFTALGVPLLEGRMLTEDDGGPDAPPVILVDEAWARTHFPGESAVGRRLRNGGATTGPWTTVVGVVGDVPYGGIGQDTGGAVYAPWTAFTRPFLFARVQGDEASVAAAIREELARIDPTAPVSDVQTGPGLLETSLVQPRHLTVVLAGFSGVALALAIIGLYGTTVHAVQSRRGDIALRLALGGSPRGVLGLVVRGSMTLVLAGIVVGGLVAPAFTRLLSGLLYEVRPTDPATLAAVAALLASVSLVACAVPGWQAVRLDPGATLREE